jgi:hypothetical protein
MAAEIVDQIKAFEQVAGTSRPPRSAEIPLVLSYPLQNLTFAVDFEAVKD